MSAPRKKRKPGRPGRPPGSKDKVKRVRRPSAPRPEPISEDPSSDEYAQHVGALQDIPPEMSFVAKCFGLDQLVQDQLIARQKTDRESDGRMNALKESCADGGVIGQPIVDSAERICADNHEMTSGYVLTPFKESELAAMDESDDMIVVPPGCELTVVPANEIFEGNELRDFAADMATEELKSILRTVSSMMTNLASYPMDHGLRCGMNEIEILLSKNREKFQK